MRLDELMGSLRTFEMNLDQNKQEKEMSFQAELQKLTVEEDVGDPQVLVESFVLLTKNFNRIWKRVKGKGFTPNSGKFNNFQKNTDAKKKKKKKTFNVTWSDEESDGSQENEDHVNNYVAFNVHQDVSNNSVADRVTNDVGTSSVIHSQKPEVNGDLSDSDSFSNDGELTQETIQEAYESMFNKWIQVVKLNKSLEKKLADTLKENETLKISHETKIAEMDKRLQEANAELEHTQNTLKTMNTSTAKLDHSLFMGKSSCDHFGLGYNGESQSSNGCSRHMTGERSFLKNFISSTDGHVTFGDGVKGKVLGKGTLDVDGLSRLKNVLLVEGLKANLISISQLSDQEPFVSFSKDKCRMIDEEENCVMEGSRSSDNCYMLVHPLSWLKATKEEIEVERIGGRKYIFVCVDDFSRFTWVNFIREKSDTFKVFQNLCSKGEKLQYWENSEN
ncbi:uncharacterized protein LOC112091467 [Morus notabilis]|uniref:uncharacterized protein LOC112091467 n=1 Tax=Morus notabilis TaxID=981085 RepID=UPI000CED7D84|nr:uncharacterized protein LOC112091467 [Morus notabilis]